MLLCVSVINNLYLYKHILTNYKINPVGKIYQMSTESNKNIWQEIIL
jgi:hypothetical protein